MNTLKKIYRFYADGFRQMTTGRVLWLIIALKLFIMFAILKVFFFPNFLGSRFDTSEEKARYVQEQLIKDTN